MPLPILQLHTDPTPDNLVRLFHRTELHWVRHVGEEAQLDAGVAFTNRDLPEVWDANLVIDAALPPGGSAPEAVEEVATHFAGVGTAPRRWILNPAAAPSQTGPLAEHLVSLGWWADAYDVMRLEGRPGGAVEEAPGLTIIPARASFRHARDLAEESESEAGVPGLAEASMLHLDDPHWDTVVALRDGKAVGRAGVLAVGDIGRVEHVFVSRDCRGQAIGRTLVGRVLDVCARSLFKHVMLSVRPDERAAIDLYGRFGFRRIGQMIAYRPPST